MYKMAEPGQLSQYGDCVTGWKTKEFGVPFPARANIYVFFTASRPVLGAQKTKKLILVSLMYKTILSNSSLDSNLFLAFYCLFQLITVSFSLF
jgi:hypothetical protein